MRYSLSKASIFNARMILSNVPTFPFFRQYREYGAAIGNGACWVFNLILTSFFQRKYHGLYLSLRPNCLFPYLVSIDKYGVSAVFFGFSIIGIAMIIIAAIMLPETRPKPRSVN
jgi:hypothetical protein